ncbi:hypothetical protein K0M31_008798 [Melipona bicolor]|uniref:Uncharacterized protein n=1 Tax=Melipona bicolor TaxID=60889 RepID=A0AA40KK26_9HYME|nr:hypothetical protein K0M31_008798 [Melipona bicolor]
MPWTKLQKRGKHKDEIKLNDRSFKTFKIERYGAIGSEKSANEDERNNILSSVAVSVKDVLAQTGGNAMLPCRFTGPGIVSTPHMYTRKYRRSR